MAPQLNPVPGLVGFHSFLSLPCTPYYTHTCNYMYSSVLQPLPPHDEAQTYVEIWFKWKIRSKNASFAKCTNGSLPSLFDRFNLLLPMTCRNTKSLKARSFHPKKEHLHSLHKSLLPQLSYMSDDDDFHLTQLIHDTLICCGLGTIAPHAPKEHRHTRKTPWLIKLPKVENAYRLNRHTKPMDQVS